MTNVLKFPARSRLGCRAVLQAKSTLERMTGVHACAVQKRRGGDYLDIVTDTRIGRQTREVPVRNGFVADADVAHALRVTLGPIAADRFVTCY